MVFDQVLNELISRGTESTALTLHIIEQVEQLIGRHLPLNILQE